jgi:hypothetical protein
LYNGTNSKNSGRFFWYDNGSIGPVTMDLYDGTHDYNCYTSLLNTNPYVHMIGLQNQGGTGGIDMYLDGGGGNNTSVGVANTNVWTTLLLGCDTTGLGVYGDYWNGIDYGFILMTNAPSAPIVWSIWNLAQQTMLPWTRSVYEGDSILFNQFSGTALGQMATNAPLWSSGLMMDTAVSGEQVNTMTNNFLYTVATNRPNGIDIKAAVPLVFEGGENSLANLGPPMTGAQCYNAVSNEVWRAHVKGFYPVAVCTVMHSGSAFTNAMQTNVDAYNALALGNTAGADLVIDQDGMMSNAVYNVSSAVLANYWTNSAALGNTFFLGDGTHPTNTGAVLYGSNIVYQMAAWFTFQRSPLPFSIPALPANTTESDRQQWTNDASYVPTLTVGNNLNVANLTPSEFVATDGSDNLTSTLNGGSLTGLNASALSSGTVAAARLPVASSSAFGVVKVDGSTITSSGGVISAAGGGGTPTFSSQFNSSSGVTNAINGAGILTNLYPSWMAVITDFGAVPNINTGSAITLNTMAIAAAYQSLTNGGILQVTPGEFFTGPLPLITNTVQIRGTGNATIHYSSSSIWVGGSFLTYSNNATPLIIFTNAANCLLRDIGLRNLMNADNMRGVVTNTTPLVINCGTNELYGLNMEDVSCNGGGVYTYTGAWWHHRDCVYQWFGGADGLLIANTNDIDQGDWVVDGGIWYTTNGNAQGIEIDSSGGGKIANCKFNQSMYGGIWLNPQLGPAASPSTSDLQIINCNLEGMANYGIWSGSFSPNLWKNITIVGCQFDGMNTPIDLNQVGNNIAITGITCYNLAGGTAVVSLSAITNASVSCIVNSSGYNSLSCDSACQNITYPTTTYGNGPITAAHL